MAGNPNPLPGAPGSANLGTTKPPKQSAIDQILAGNGQTPIAGTPRNINADKLNAEVSRQQYNDWLKSYVPFENKLIGEATDPNFYQGKINQAGSDAISGYQSAIGSTERDLSRYGLTLTPEQRVDLDRIRKFGTTTSDVNALNTSRDTLYGQQIDTLDQLANVGQSQAGSAQGILGGQAQAQAQRNAANDQIQAQQSAALWGTIGTVVGTAALFAA